MGQSGENCKGCNMLQQVLTSSLVLLALTQAAPQVGKGLPVLFQFSHPTHNVAVFRGAALKQAIAAGVVKGFGSLGSDSDAANAGAQEERDGRSDEGDDGEGAGSYAPPPTTGPPPPLPPPLHLHLLQPPRPMLHLPQLLLTSQPPSPTSPPPLLPTSPTWTSTLTCPLSTPGSTPSRTTTATTTSEPRRPGTAI